MSRPPVVAFAAWSGTGKTTLLRRVIPLLKARGLRIGVVKHAHHGFEIDHPGKDSYEVRKAGADQVVVGSAERWALVVETPERTAEPSLAELMSGLRLDALDLVLVEGFKPEPVPKIEIHRPALGKPLIAATDPRVVAIATDAPERLDTDLPLLDLDDPAAVAAFIVERFLG